MKKRRIVSIAKPCTENWGLMTPSEKGRFCGLCNKEVIDFTKMTADQVVDCLTNKSGQKICGLFLNSQLGKPKTKFNQWLTSAYLQTLSHTKIGSTRIAALMVLGFVISLTGCEDTVNETIAKPAAKIPKSSIIEEDPKIEKLEVFRTKGEACATEDEDKVLIKKK